jgi:hypothetical protein
VRARMNCRRRPPEGPPHAPASRAVASIEPDHDLWRVRLPDGQLSDVVNLARARDAAVTLALGVLNRGRREAA